MATPLEKSTPKEIEDHERDEIEFVDVLPDELKCSICLLVFKDPILTDCGHHFCQACIAPVSSRNARCPLCNEEGFRTFPDKSTTRKIKSLQIKCKKRVEGCEWVGEYGRLEHHLGPKEGDCGFVEVECDFHSVGCTTRALRKDLPQHMETNLILMSTASPKAGGETERQLQERRAELLQQQLQKKEEDTQRRFKEKDEQIKALKGRVESLEQQFRCPPCDFIMHDFSKHKAADDEWLSPPFYSHPGGYKLRLAVYANGHDQRKGTHVSFVHYTMQGEYDHQLEWLRILDTNIHMLNHNTVKWEQNIGCQNYRCTKPKVAQERRTCWHNRTISDLDPYLKDDCIHFQVAGVTPC